MLLSMVYVKNMQGKLQSCFVYSEDYEVFGKVHKIKQKKEGRRKIIFQCILLIISMILMTVVIVVFLKTENNLNKMESNSAIIKIHLLRGGVTFLAIIFLFLLSSVLSTISYKSLTKYCWKYGCYSEEIRDKARDKWEWGIWAWVIYYVFFLVYVLLDGCLIIMFYALRVTYYLLFGLINVLPDLFSNCVAHSKLDAEKQSQKDFLCYAYLR